MTTLLPSESSFERAIETGSNVHPMEFPLSNQDAGS
jgi:hypothetical protein